MAPALLLLVALTGWGAGAPSASASGAALTPKGLAAIVKAYGRAMDQANQTLDVTLQDEHETGTAAQIDDYTFASDIQQRFTTDDGTTYFTARNQLVRELIPTVAHKRVALAVTRTVYAAGTPRVDACRDGGSLLVFERPTSRGPWRVGLEPTVELRRVPSLATSGGYGTLVTSGRGLRTAPAKVPAAFSRQLATELNAYAASRSVAGLPAYLFGTEDCFGLFNPPDLVEGFAYRFEAQQVSPSDLAAFRTADGGALVLFSVETETLMAVTTTTTQPGQPVTSEQVAGRGLIEVAVVVPPAAAHHSKPYTVIGGYSGDIAPGATSAG
jgi:hypothetical protein